MEVEEITTENTKTCDSTRIHMDLSHSQGEMILTFYNLATFKAEDAAPGTVSAYTVSEDHRYLYYYCRGSLSIVCVDIGTRDLYSIDISQDFVDEVTKAEASSSKVAKLSLHSNGDSGELVLCYTMVNNQDSSQSSLPDIDPRGIMTCGINLYYTLSGTAFSPRYYQFMKFYEGDGYFTITFAYGDEIFVAVEDSRDNTRTYYRYQGITTDSPLEFVERNTSKTNIEGLKEFLEARKIVIQPAQIDYNRQYQEEQNDPKKNSLSYQNIETFLPCVDGYLVYKGTDRTQAREITFNETEIRRILSVATSLPITSDSIGNNWEVFYEINLHLKQEYSYSLGIVSVFIGRYQEKPYLTYGSFQGEISEDDYQWISSWCEDWLAENIVQQ